MRKTYLSVAALIGAVAMGFGSSANASVIVSTVREAGPTAGTDAILVYALGLGADSTLVSVQASLHDTMSAGLQMGSFQITTGAPAKKGFYGDPDGQQAAVANVSDANGIPISYSWIGDGDFNTTGFTAASQEPDANSGTTISAGPYTTSAQNPFTGPMSAFHVDAGWTVPVDASALGGGVGNGQGAIIAVAIVPKGDAVAAFGNIGGQVNTVPFSVTNGTPEPASLGLLALGGVALLTRRNKKA